MAAKEEEWPVNSEEILNSGPFLISGEVTGRELSLVYRNVSDGIFFLATEADGDFRFISVNPAFCRTIGLKEAQVAGRRLSEVATSFSAEPALARYREAIREGKAVSWEDVSDSPGGRSIVAVSVTPIFDTVGRCISLVGTVRDIGEQRQAERMRAQLAAVVESSDDAIVSKTLEGVITTWNRGAERIFGYTAEEAIGRPINILIPPDRANEEPEILGRIRQGERVDHFETVRMRKDGVRLFVSVTISPIHDGNGIIVGASKIARDITAQKRMEETLRESEERHRLLGQIVPHLLWMTDAEGNPVYFNERWYAYTGQSEAEAVISGRSSVLHDDDRERTRAAWKNSVQAGAPFECEYRLRRHDGEYRWFVARGIPVRDESGRIGRWYGSSTDVHDRKLTAEALREQYIVTEQLNAVARALATELDAEKVVQIITDAGTRIIRAQFGAFFHNHVDEKGESYTLYTLSGASREAFEKFPMPRATEIFGPTFRGEGVIRLDDVRKDPRFGKNPPFRGMPEGHLPVVSYLALPVIGRSGAVLGGLFFGHGDAGVFTERDEKIVVGIAAQAAAAMDNARLYEAEQSARAAAERASKAKDDFLATLSHELRNPLNPVLLIASEASQNTELPDEVREDFEVIQRNIELEARLIDDLLDLTRITRRKMSLELRPLDVHEVLREAIAIVRREADNKQMTVTSRFLAAKPRVMGDPARLQQVFWNVLRNAVKFTPQKGTITIATRDVAERQEIEVEVNDSGIGMRPEEIARIFDAFAQGDHASSTGSHRFGGLGLGLAIAQYLVQMHGGRIQAESAGAGQGSTFRIALPRLDRSEET